MKQMKHKMALSILMASVSIGASAQVNAADSVMNHAKGNKFSVGGYGEAAYSRNFYSDSGNRYTTPRNYKKDPSHGRFDIPHAVIYLGYDFGKGWTMGTEIEFEHGGSGSAIEYEADEAIEFEHETEKGGEVELEQFWLQKTFGRAFNVRAGHIVAGLDAYHFSRANWIQGGTSSPFEFEVANKYGFLARVDNYTLPGLRLGVSGYFGQSMHNNVPHDMERGAKKKIKGNVYLGSLDFTFKRYNWVARGNVDYGYVSHAKEISQLTYPNVQYVKPYESGNGKYFGSHAIAMMLEVGYDVFSQIKSLRADNQKLYVFGHIENYDSYIHAATKKWTNKTIYAAGLNYYPIPQIAIKAEYNYRKLKSGYNNEPAINIGVAYEGFFL